MTRDIVDELRKYENCASDGTPGISDTTLVSWDGMLRPAIDEIERLRARCKALEEALEPFAEFGRNNTDDTGWAGIRAERERIYVWFGPSDFICARRTLKAEKTDG